MQIEYERKYHELEKKHYWFNSRRKFIHQLLKQYPKDSKILDIGCSSGVLLKELLDYGYSVDNLYGVDISSKAIALCQENGITNAYQMDAQNINLDVKFDLIIASDCLEHLELDETALSNWYNLLKPTGIAMIFVPAFMSLWSNHDVVNMHYRRYTKSELNHKLKQNGFTIQRSSYWNFLLFTPVWIYRFVSRLIGSKEKANTKGDIEEISIFNSFLQGILSVENKMLQGINLPVGVSVFSIVTKK